MRLKGPIFHLTTRCDCIRPTSHPKLAVWRTLHWRVVKTLSSGAVNLFCTLCGSYWRSKADYAKNLAEHNGDWGDDDA